MNPHAHLSEEQPAIRLVVDERPPTGAKVWMIGAAGTGFVGSWHPEYQVVGWCPLPKMTVEQKTRLRQLMAEGIDITKPLKEVHVDNT